jgi:hypothetical protein
MDRNPLVMTYTLSLSNKEIPSHGLIICRVTGYVFIDQDFTSHHELPLCPLKPTHAIEVIDG